MRIYEAGLAVADSEADARTRFHRRAIDLTPPAAEAAYRHAIRQVRDPGERDAGVGWTTAYATINAATGAARRGGRP